MLSVHKTTQALSVQLNRTSPAQGIVYLLPQAKLLSVPTLSPPLPTSTYPPLPYPSTTLLSVSVC